MASKSVVWKSKPKRMRLYRAFILLLASSARDSFLAKELHFFLFHISTGRLDVQGRLFARLDMNHRIPGRRILDARIFSPWHRDWNLHRAYKCTLAELSHRMPGIGRNRSPLQAKSCDAIEGVGAIIERHIVELHLHILGIAEQDVEGRIPDE